jgi:hypothetical protein
MTKPVHFAVTKGMAVDYWDKTNAQVKEMHPNYVWRGRAELFEDQAAFLIKVTTSLMPHHDTRLINTTPHARSHLT